MRNLLHRKWNVSPLLQTSCINYSSWGCWHADHDIQASSKQYHYFACQHSSEGTTEVFHCAKRNFLSIWRVLQPSLLVTTTFTSGFNNMEAATPCTQRHFRPKCSIIYFRTSFNSAQVPDLVPSSTHSGNDMYSEGAASIFLGATFVNSSLWEVSQASNVLMVALSPSF